MYIEVQYRSMKDIVLRNFQLEPPGEEHDSNIAKEGKYGQTNNSQDESSNVIISLPIDTKTRFVHQLL